MAGTTITINVLLLLTILSIPFAYSTVRIGDASDGSVIVGVKSITESSVSSVTSSTNCITVDPTTGDVVLTFNESCGGSGGGSSSPYNWSQYPAISDVDMDGNSISNMGNIDFKTGATGGTLRTGTSAADSFELEAYDVNDGIFRNVFRVEAGNDVVAFLEQIRNISFNNGAYIDDLQTNELVIHAGIVNITNNLSVEDTIFANGQEVLTSESDPIWTANSTLVPYLANDNTYTGHNQFDGTVEVDNYANISKLSLGDEGFVNDEDFPIYIKDSHPSIKQVVARSSGVVALNLNELDFLDTDTQVSIGAGAFGVLGELNTNMWYFYMNPTTTSSPWRDAILKVDNNECIGIGFPLSTRCSGTYKLDVMGSTFVNNSLVFGDSASIEDNSTCITLTSPSGTEYTHCDGDATFDSSLTVTGSLTVDGSINAACVNSETIIYLDDNSGEPSNSYYTTSGGVETSADFGRYIPYDATIKSVTYGTRSVTVADSQTNVLVNGVNVLNVTLSTGSHFNTTVQDVELNAGDYISQYKDGLAIASVDDTNLIVHIQRRCP